MLGRPCSSIVVGLGRRAASSSTLPRPRAASSLLRTPTLPSTVHLRSAATTTDSESLSSRISPSLADDRTRLFAVVYVNERQWKVTAGDVIQLLGPSPLEVGERIKLEKVLAIGGADFSIFGRPLLDSKSVQVEAVVMERSHKYPELYYRHFNHQQTVITKWRTTETTLLRIESVRASADLLNGSSSEDTKEAQTA